MSTLQDLLDHARAKVAEDERLKAAKKKLSVISGSKHPAAQDEIFALLAQVRALEAKRVWTTQARIALLHTQTCATCGSHHEMFMGWMLEQTHSTDKTARKLVACKVEDLELDLPERKEEHFQGTVATCGDCVECVIAINLAARTK
jgi:DNA-directed RNA polymerase subunit M/transcription elongation factor TFIIS